MTEADVKKRIAKMVKAHGQAGVANDLGVTQQYISMITSGHRTVGPKVLRALGLRKLVIYEEVGK